MNNAVRWRAAGLRDWIPCIDGTPGVETLPFAAELPGEPVVTTQSFDGFLGTDLDGSWPGAESEGRPSLGPRQTAPSGVHELAGRRPKSASEYPAAERLILPAIWAAGVAVNGRAAGCQRR
jgi:hypothetical protein